MSLNPVSMVEIFKRESSIMLQMSTYLIVFVAVLIKEICVSHSVISMLSYFQLQLNVRKVLFMLCNAEI